ncbi:DUF4384 domain-containing protein [Tateyamaria omphalii]|uniref:DUF4384 domain-containing protein n=1 Tax=Tateyamaria omphalii TaxID=299262 RepID=A0A1P8N1T6_9RHOB|nr:DUF4384 domain-containing protein [Tateyamaria omphalii]APX14274.1 hypothetical protein BWR18_20715 [Tateyamaria omphalii]
MMRLCLNVIAVVSWCFATTSLHAQQTDATAEINALVNKAFGELTDLQEAYFDIRGKLVDWENSNLRSNRTALTGVSTDDAAYRDVASAIVSHPLVPRADIQCREHLGALLTPGNVVDESALLACGRSIDPRVRHSEAYECSSLFWAVDPAGTLRLNGHVQGSGDLAALRSKYGEQTVATVVERPFPTCAAIEALELPMSSQDRPYVRMLSQRDRIAFGESLAFELTTPDFYAFLYVVYLQADGSIFNLMPRRSLLRQQQDPQSTLRFGDGLDGRQRFTASAPAGTEAIIAVAARSPIDGLDALEVPGSNQYAKKNGQPVDQAVFLEILKDSLQDEFDATRGRREISADVLHLTVVP